MRLSPRRCLLVLVLLLSVGSAAAQELDLYEGEAPVQGQDAAEREAALAQALAQVVVKLTGIRGAAADPRIRAELRRAPELARQFRYRQDLDVSGGTPVYLQYLVARFDPAGLEAMLAEAGLPVWPAPRPRLHLWLVIDDGRGPRLVGAAQANAVRALSRRAEERGIRVTLPAADETNAELALRAAWRGEAEALAALAERHGSAPLLLGRLARSGTGWSVEWTLREGGSEVARWSASHEDARLALSDGADGAVDALGRRYADLLASGPPGSYEIVVHGLRSGEDYLRLMGYLDTLAIVRSAAPLQARDDSLRLRLELAAGLEGFRRLVAGGRTLGPAAARGDEALFRLRP